MGTDQSVERHLGHQTIARPHHQAIPTCIWCCRGRGCGSLADGYCPTSGSELRHGIVDGAPEQDGLERGDQRCAERLAIAGKGNRRGRRDGPLRSCHRSDALTRRRVSGTGRRRALRGAARRREQERNRRNQQQPGHRQQSRWITRDRARGAPIDLAGWSDLSAERPVRANGMTPRVHCEFNTPGRLGPEADATIRR